MSLTLIRFWRSLTNVLAFSVGRVPVTGSHSSAGSAPTNAEHGTDGHEHAAISQIVEQAAGWFAELRAAELAESEREEFWRWLRQSPQHVQAYVERACADPCSTVRTQGPRQGTRRRRHK